MPDFDSEQHDRFGQPRTAGVTEQLATAASDGDGDDVYHVEGIAIGDGDITNGLSGKKTHWSPEKLSEAHEAGRVGEGKFIKGGGGDAHKDPFDLADPDNIVGGYTIDYEPGRGLTFNGDLIDERLATLIDHDLVEISPDVFRDLGEFDEELGAHDVEEIIGMPYITILDQGAAPSNSIEISEAEALAHADWLDDRLGQQSSGSPTSTTTSASPGVPADAVEAFAAADGRDFSAESTEQLRELYTLRFSAYGDFVGDEFIDDAVTDLSAIAGVNAVRSQGNDDPEVIAVLDRDELTLDGLNDAIIDALDDTPFEVWEDWDWLSHISDQLAPDDDGAGGGDGGGSSGGSDGDDPGGTDPGTDTTTMPDKDPEELREELREQKNRAEELEDEKEDLETTLEDEREQREDLEAELEPVRNLLGEVAASGDTALTGQLAADKFDVSELAEMCAGKLDDEYDPDSDDNDQSAYETVADGLSGQLQMRGGNDGSDAGGAGGDDDVDDEEVEQLAKNALTVGDLRQIEAEGLSARAYIEREYDVDAANYGTTEALQGAVNQQEGDA